jgi:hypothetical protein
MPTRRGDVLILLTAQTFTVHVVGLVTQDGQQDFQTSKNTTYVRERADAVAQAKACVMPEGRIFFRNLDSDQWSEIAQEDATDREG